MACLLIRIEDRGAGKLAAFTAGDIIYIAPDDHIFSPAEKAGGVLRVVKIPGLSVEAMRLYTQGNATKRRSIGLDMRGALGDLLRAASDVVALNKQQAWALLDSSRER